MDFVKLFPTEICQKIFSFLSGEELWNTFQVSPSWKNIANDNFLWRRLCLQCDIDVDLQRFKTDDCFSDLCLYAKIWGVWRWDTVRNWELDIYNEVKLPPKDPSSYCITSCGDCLAYSDGCQIFVFTKKNSDIAILLEEYMDIHPNAVVVRALEMNKHYLVVLNNTSVLVYRTSDYKPYLLIYFVTGRLEINRDNFSNVNLPGNSVEFVLLHDHFLWIGEYLFLKSTVIVDLRTGQFKEVLFPWKCTLMRINENVIARADSLLAVYSLAGEKNFEMRILNYSLLNTSKSVLALITDSEIHTYNRMTGQLLGQIKKSFFEFHINYKADIIYGLSKTRQKSKILIEAVSLLTGSLKWSIKHFGEYTSEVRPFLGSFLCYTCSDSEYWYILDRNTGKIMHKKPLARQTLIHYVSDLFFVCQTSDSLVIKFY